MYSKQQSKKGLYMIKLLNVKKIYDNNSIPVSALNGISLEISDGDFVAIMGASGSGKTTLLNLIGGMDMVSAGEYYADELAIHSMNKNDIDSFRRDKIGFVFQNFALLRDYTVKENVEIPLRAKNVGKKDRNQMVSEILKKLGLSDYENSLPSSLSGGQQQRCAIARALVSGANIILADEPTGALDSVTGQEIMDLLKDINREGRTVIVVTHDEKLASQMNRIIYIKDGMIEEQF